MNIQERAHHYVTNAQQVNFPAILVLQTVIIAQLEHLHHQKAQVHAQFAQQEHILVVEQVIVRLAQLENFLQNIHQNAMTAL